MAPELHPCLFQPFFQAAPHWNAARAGLLPSRNTQFGVDTAAFVAQVPKGRCSARRVQCRWVVGVAGRRVPRSESGHHGGASGCIRQRERIRAVRHTRRTVAGYCDTVGRRRRDFWCRCVFGWRPRRLPEQGILFPCRVAQAPACRSLASRLRPCLVRYRHHRESREGKPCSSNLHACPGTRERQV